MFGIIYVKVFFQVEGSSAITKSGIICRIEDKYWARRSFHWSTLMDFLGLLRKKM